MKAGNPDMKTLGLLRHANSDWDDMATRDFDRGLNDRGRRGATLIGTHITRHGVKFDRLLASPAERVRQTYANVFPSLQGVRLSNRMEAAPFDKLLERVDEAVDLEPGRRQAAMASLSDKLKSDFRKGYSRHLA